MKTIVLPGYSPHNEEWAQKTVIKLKKAGFSAEYHAWQHWKSGKSFNLNREIEAIIKEIGKDSVNIIAKSVGVMVALNLIPLISKKVFKVILCGIAGVSGEDRQSVLEEVIETVPVGSILCIQNKKDRFIPFSEAEKFYHSVDKSINVISKPRSDHHYPYYKDFVEFLKS